MRKVRTTLPIKGLHVPRFFLWLKGVIHGKIIHTGGLDPGTNTISSGYITGQIKRFNTACIVRCEEANDRLKHVWNEACQLLIDLKRISSSKNSNGKGASMSPRVNEKTTNILKRIATIVNDIRAEQTLVQDQISATAELLLSTFSCYGHGLLMKPIFASYLPRFSFEEYTEEIIKRNQDTWDDMIKILKEEVRTNEHL